MNKNCANCKRGSDCAVSAMTECDVCSQWEPYTKLEQVQNLMKEHGIELIGSRAWGGANDSSDYDYIMSHIDYEDIKSRLEKICEEPVTEIPESYEQSQSKYINCFDNSPSPKFTVNLILLGSTTLQAWSDANKMMFTAPKYVIDNRQKRRYLFTVLCSFFKHLRD